jgi:hypothetical protein
VGDFGTSGGILSHPWLWGGSINLPEEGVKTSRKILNIRGLSKLKKSV